MPRIESVSRPREGLVANWQRRDVRGHPDFPAFKPRVQTVDMFSLMYGPQPFRQEIHTGQIYSNKSRREYQAQYQKALEGVRQGRCLQLRWRVSRELPAFSPDFLMLYLARFGKVDAIHQLTFNSCLVIFANEQTMRAVLNNRHLGLPYGRLVAKQWIPCPQDQEYYRVARHLQACASSPARRAAHMDRDDRHAFSDPERYAARAMAMNNRAYGPSLKYYLVDGLKEWRRPKEAS